MNNPEVSLFFPEPVLKYKFEDYKNFNLNLKKYIYELIRKNRKLLENYINKQESQLELQ